MRYQALLAVAQAAHSRRDLSSVLEATAGALDRLVPVDLLALVAHEETEPRVLAAYYRNVPRRPGEEHGRYVERITEATGSRGQAREHELMRRIVEKERRTLLLNDVRGDPRLEGSSMRRTGARCAVVLPLAIGDEFVSTLVVARMSESPFSPDEVSILEDVAEPVASAVANALAFEEIQRLRGRLEDENLALREEIAATAAAGGIIGTSAGLRGVLDRVGRVAPTDSTVLITGETGTGKELIARAIHMQSSRAKHALVKVNCAALPEGLIASELFGHEKGAFTGAMERRRGASSWRPGGRFSWTKSASCRQRSRSPCCASCRSANSSASGGASPCGRTPAWWRPPTGTWRKRSATGNSATTSSSGSTCSPSASRRCASAPRTFRSSPSTA